MHFYITYRSDNVRVEIRKYFEVKYDKMWSRNLVGVAVVAFQERCFTLESPIRMKVRV